MFVSWIMYSLYLGIVRPKILMKPLPDNGVTRPTQAGSQDCVRNNSISAPSATPLTLVFNITGPWGITLTIGCLLLLLNVLILANIYHHHFRTNARCMLQSQNLISKNNCMIKSQSAPELATTSFNSGSNLHELSMSCQLNKLSV